MIFRILEDQFAQKSKASKAADLRFMQLALTLGRRGQGRSWPNPAVGAVVHAPSGPPVSMRTPLPLLRLPFQPRPCSSSRAPSGSGPIVAGSIAPCVLPKVWPPTISATVSSSFIAMRANVSRMSLAAATGSGLPLGPSGGCQ